MKTIFIALFVALLVKTPTAISFAVDDKEMVFLRCTADEPPKGVSQVKVLISLSKNLLAFGGSWGLRTSSGTRAVGSFGMTEIIQGSYFDETKNVHMSTVRFKGEGPFSEKFDLFIEHEWAGTHRTLTSYSAVLSGEFLETMHSSLYGTSQKDVKMTCK